jgi:short subunit dehydrogenase-like uncharacterized protein
MAHPRYDVVVFGATSFVGQILARYLAEHFAGANEALRWTIAGRSATKLEELSRSLGAAGRALEPIVADATNEEQLRSLCAQTRVVASTVGPYALYGEPLVKVCAAGGTDYCDLTGEPQWIRRMIERYEPSAARSGARIVNCCGFDSIPSDMGVWFLQQQARELFGHPCHEVKMRVRSLKGGASGGTVASGLNIVREAAGNPALRKELADPYSLCPPGHGFGARQHNVRSAEFDRDFEAWSAPFVMAAVNTRIVHRSNALSGNAYGDDFRYDEAMLMGKGIRGRMRAMSLSAGLAAFVAGAIFGPTRALLERTLPQPGEGPSPEAQQKGRYDLRFVGKSGDGRTLRTKVTGDRDPGYGSTAKILGQAAASMALDNYKGEVKSGRPGGFWTPATMFDQRLVDRLTRHAGLAFDRVS